MLIEQAAATPVSTASLSLKPGQVCFKGLSLPGCMTQYDTSNCPTLPLYDERQAQPARQLKGRYVERTCGHDQAHACSVDVATAEYCKMDAPSGATIQASARMAAC